MEKNKREEEGEEKGCRRMKMKRSIWKKRI